MSLRTIFYSHAQRPLWKLPNDLRPLFFPIDLVHSRQPSPSFNKEIGSTKISLLHFESPNDRFKHICCLKLYKSFRWWKVLEVVNGEFSWWVVERLLDGSMLKQWMLAISLFNSLILFFSSTFSGLVSFVVVTITFDDSCYILRFD